MSLVTRAVTAHLDQITPIRSGADGNALPDGMPRGSVLPEDRTLAAVPGRIMLPECQIMQLE